MGGSSLVKGKHPLRSRTTAGRFLLLTLLLMVAFYSALYQPYSEQSLPGRLLVAHLELVARASGGVLQLLGEPVSVQGTSVSGRFPYLVVLDCAALDAQALFAAAVLAFPVRLRPKLLGLAGGLVLIALLNVGRLVLLYFAGVHSERLFQVLHEEVMVLLIILAVCGLFVSWARWALRQTPQPSQLEPEHAT